MKPNQDLATRLLAVNKYHVIGFVLNSLQVCWVMTKEALLFYGYSIDDRCYMFHRNLADLEIRYRDHTNVRRHQIMTQRIVLLFLNDTVNVSAYASISSPCMLHMLCATSGVGAVCSSKVS
jgi:hypothetical protein